MQKYSGGPFVSHSPYSALKLTLLRCNAKTGHFLPKVQWGHIWPHDPNMASGHPGCSQIILNHFLLLFLSFSIEIWAGTVILVICLWGQFWPHCTLERKKCMGGQFWPHCTLAGLKKAVSAYAVALQIRLFTVFSLYFSRKTNMSAPFFPAPLRLPDYSLHGFFPY